jgi:phosphoglycerate dehydrogenase-like enzyme
MQSAHPEIEWLWQPELLPPRRHPADFAGVPGFQRSVADQAAYEALVDSADVLFGIPDTDPAALHRCALANSRLRWLHTMAAGGGAQVRAAELPAERLATMTVTTSAGVHGTGLAEFALLGLLAGLKDLPRLERDRHAHHWPDRAPVRQLRGAVILVLGAGGIGRRVAELAGAFGATAWGLAHHRSASLPGFDRVVDSGDLRAVLAEVDAVVACLPGTDATWHLVDADFLAALKPGAVVVNVGRGSVVDEQALWASLVDGQVGFAALDVFENEPLTADSPLWDCDRVLISPHTAALDEGEEERIVTLFLANLRRWLDGRDLQNVMTDEFY